MAFLDSEIQTLLAEKDYFDKNPDAGRHPLSDEDRIPVSIVFTGDIQPIEQAGFQANGVFGNVSMGSADIRALRTLAALPQVVRIEGRREHLLLLSSSVPHIQANKVWTQTGNDFIGYTGQGVIVGIIDTGIDFNHHVFKKPDGTSRIMKIWDQTINAPLNPPVVGENPPSNINNTHVSSSTITLGYGVEYSRTQITDTITYLADTAHNPKPAVVVRHVDSNGHGTHVAGIAAGNGSQSGDCFGAFRYIGVAPDADIIMVRVWGISKGDHGENLTPPQTLTSPTPATVNNDFLMDAINYIVDQATSTDPIIPLAINISLGIISDTMDGTGALSLAVDNLLKNNTGLAVVFAAGNDGGSAFHARVTVGASPAIVALPVELAADDKQKRYVAIRYTGSNIQVRLTSPGGTVIPWVAAGGSPTTNNTINGTGSTVTITNSPNNILIAITPPTGGKNIPGAWKIELQSTVSTPTIVDGFCNYADPNSATAHKFSDKSQCTSQSTLCENAAGIESISVGNYSIGLISGTSLADSSSRGPTMETPPKTPRTKPDLCAPGETITSAGLASDRCSCCCTCCQSYYVDKSGTSMAAPHVTGTIALMLHKNPGLSHTDIKAKLIANIDPKDSGSTPDQDLGWGAGGVNANKTVSTMAQVNPPVTSLAEALAPEHAASMQEQFLATKNGKTLAGLFDKYFPEIMDLVNHNKRVATTWHRCKGPVWTRLAMQAFHSPGMRLQPVIEGMTLQEAAAKFLSILKEYASGAFQMDFRPFEPVLADFSREMTIPEMIQLVGEFKYDTPSWLHQPVH